MNEWQYTNQFFEEGREHFSSGGEIKDCPYNYLNVDQDDEKKVQSELYRQQEWLAGFRCQFIIRNDALNSTFEQKIA
jgi:hypothetical protein